MKERIVIDNNQHLPRASYYVAKDGHYDVGTVNYATPETILNENRIVAVKEQVPETWEDLLELCKKINNKKIEIIFVDIRIIVHLEDNCEISFTETMGAMWFKKNDFETRIRIDLTPQQMWNIIKSLIGEE